MRLILPALVLLLLAGCGLKDDLYLPEDAPTGAIEETSEESEQQDDDAQNA